MWITNIWFGAEEHGTDNHLLSSNENVQAEVVTEKHVSPRLRFRRLAEYREAAGALMTSNWSGLLQFLTSSSSR